MYSTGVLLSSHPFVHQKCLFIFTIIAIHFIHIMFLTNRWFGRDQTVAALSNVFGIITGVKIMARHGVLFWSFCSVMFWCWVEVLLLVHSRLKCRVLRKIGNIPAVCIIVMKRICFRSEGFTEYESNTSIFNSCPGAYVDGWTYNTQFIAREVVWRYLVLCPTPFSIISQTYTDSSMPVIDNVARTEPMRAKRELGWNFTFGYCSFVKTY
jgi:hypothetical protein